jgi:hypothetical protein
MLNMTETAPENWAKNIGATAIPLPCNNRFLAARGERLS